MPAMPMKHITGRSPRKELIMAKGCEYEIDIIWYDDQEEATQRVWVGDEYPEERDEEFFFHFEDMEDLLEYLDGNPGQDFKILRYRLPGTI